MIELAIEPTSLRRSLRMISVMKCEFTLRMRSVIKRRFFFSSRRRHTRSVSAFLLNRSSDLQDNHEYPFLYQRQTCHQVQPNQATYQKRQKCQPATYLQEVLYQL